MCSKLARSDVTMVCRARVRMDVALDTRAGRVLIRDLETYMVDAPMDVLFVGDDVLHKLGISPQHLLEQKVASGEVKDIASPYPEYSCLNETFNEDDDVVIYKLPSQGFLQGKAFRDLFFEFRDIWRVRLSADGPVNLTPLKVYLKPDAVPHTAKPRRYAPQHLDFMRKQIELLEEMGCILRNPRCRMSSG